MSLATLGIILLLHTIHFKKWFDKRFVKEMSAIFSVIKSVWKPFHNSVFLKVSIIFLPILKHRWTMNYLNFGAFYVSWWSQRSCLYCINDNNEQKANKGKRINKHEATRKLLSSSATIIQTCNLPGVFREWASIA